MLARIKAFKVKRGNALLDCLFGDLTIGYIIKTPFAGLDDYLSLDARINNSQIEYCSMCDDTCPTFVIKKNGITFQFTHIGHVTLVNSSGIRFRMRYADYALEQDLDNSKFDALLSLVNSDIGKNGFYRKKFGSVTVTVYLDFEFAGRGIKEVVFDDIHGVLRVKIDGLNINLTTETLPIVTAKLADVFANTTINHRTTIVDGVCVLDTSKTASKTVVSSVSYTYGGQTYEKFIDVISPIILNKLNKAIP